MTQKLPKKTLDKLRELEPKLQRASKYGQFNEADKIIKEIQKLFIHNRDHHRILRAKNWYYQAALEANRIDDAISGFESIRIRAKENTRIYLEATVLLGICYLRKKNIEAAKIYIKEAISSINNIQSDSRRNQFQKRIVDRVESESIISFLSSKDAIKIESEKLHNEAVKLLQTKSDIEIFSTIGSSVSKDVLHQIEGIKDYSIKLLPPKDQKLLPPAKELENDVTFGKRIAETIKRISWRAICDPKSQIYNLWNKQIPEVFNKGYFASAVAVTLAQYSIGLPLIAAGVVAIIMKYSAMDFCERFKPKDIMISQKEKG
jgi:tetratricopeptide (TPR) repeat protein